MSEEREVRLVGPHERRQDMTEGILGRLAVLTAALLATIAVLVVGAGSASAAVIYNNQNTVPTVGAKTEDTFSEAFVGAGNTSIGGLVEFAGTQRRLKSLTTEVDSFRCEEGVYFFENCRSRAGKKFKYTITAKIYEATGTLERGALVGQTTATVKVPYRPTTNVSCPRTSEGKGFGANCDIGGVLATIEFKHFTNVLLPSKAIIELTTPTPDDDVNVGLEGAFKEYDVATEEYVGIPGSGSPEVGSDPLPSDLFLNGLSNEGWEGYLPVFKVIAK